MVENTEEDNMEHVAYHKVEVATLNAALEVYHRHEVES